MQSDLIIVAVGSNLGDAKANVEQAIRRLGEISGVPVVASSLWRSTPVNCPPGSPAFINAVAKMAPIAGETPESFLSRLQGLEREFGRAPRKIVNEPRPLDLDLIAFGEEVRNTPELILPHPRAHLRRFVLAPLAEIAPDLVLPGQKKSVRELLDALRTEEIVERLS